MLTSYSYLPHHFEVVLHAYLSLFSSPTLYLSLSPLSYQTIRHKQIKKGRRTVSCPFLIHVLNRLTFKTMPSFPIVLLYK